MTITLRSTKGAALTHAELDANFTTLDSGKAALAGAPAQAFALATATAGTNTTQGASTAFVINEFGRHDNLILNGGFVINQMEYASAATLAAGAYGHDQWKGGAAGGNYSFTQLASDTQITIASGKSLIQIIEDKHVQFTSYVLAWEGTAQGRFAVNGSTPGGTYAASPIAITGQTVGTKMSVEFNEGTLGKVTLSNSLGVNKRIYEHELALCQRYHFREKASSVYYMYGLCWTADTNIAYLFRPLPVPMYAIPSLEQDGTATDYGIYTNAGYSCSAVPALNSATTKNSALIQLTFAGTLTANQVGFARSNNNTNSYLGFAARLT